MNGSHPKIAWQRNGISGLAVAARDGERSHGSKKERKGGVLGVGANVDACVDFGTAVVHMILVVPQVSLLLM